MASKNTIHFSTRKSVFARLDQFDILADENDYIEVTKWASGEGFDVNIYDNGDQWFHLTFGQLKALKKLVKRLDNE